MQLSKTGQTPVAAPHVKYGFANGTEPQVALSNGSARLRTLLSRLWQYQRERFPLKKHGVVVAAFCLAGMSLSAAMRSAISLPDVAGFCVCSITTATLFLMLRIADEHKDREEDAAYRPYLPVPRGLVTLGELRAVFAVCMFVQLVLNAIYYPALLVLLGSTWLYLFLMTEEFFVRNWLRKHHIVYLASHMVIMPIIDAYITACDWLPSTSGQAPSGLLWFLLLSFCNGIVLEIGRKIRNPEEEEKGVETYSALWGQRRATFAWAGVISIAAIFALCAASACGTLVPATIALSVLIIFASVLIAKITGRKLVDCASKMELCSGMWLLVIYLTLGLSPLLTMVGK